MERLKDDTFLRFINIVFQDNIPWKIINALIREEGGLTLRELARRVGVAPKTSTATSTACRGWGCWRCISPAPGLSS